MLELQSVHTHYGLSHVLQGVSLSLAQGEVLGLFGRNGVGKTTVMKTIAGWVPASQGSVRLEGVDLAGQGSDRICRRGVGFVPEDRRIFPGLTVEENLRLGFNQVPGRTRAAARARLEATYERFPRLAERRRQMGTTLSGGEQQMLAIARVLVGQPRLLLIDEPTEGLAPIIVDELFGLMTGLAAEGIPILLVEQNVKRAVQLVTRWVVLERGQVVDQGHTRDAGERERLFQRLAV
jgi:branched-chain amino acid transport system ATP-binding protein